MPVHSPRRKLTYADYLRFPDDGNRHEILAGIHHVTPTPFIAHQRISSDLHILLGSFIRKHGLGEILAAPMGVVLSEHDVVEPDLLFIAKARCGELGERHIEGPPDLCVEILSKSTRRLDLGVKRAHYERSGVSEYWVVDPERLTVQIYRRAGEGQAEFLPPVHLSAEADDRLATPLLPGLSIALREIFR